MTAISISPAFGFGDYSLPEGKTFSQMQLCAKVQKIFFAVLYSVLAALSMALIPVSLPLAIAGTAAFSYKAIQAVLRAIGTFYRAPPMQNLFSKEVKAALPPLGQYAEKPCSGFATRDSAESHEWKLNLIRAAKQSILLSGCYCGGKAFDETLDLIRERMRIVPTLTASILSSDIFVTSENKKRIQAMEKEFKDCFICVVTPEVFPYTSPETDRFSFSTNHTKALVIDCGAAFMVGGSGIVSPWSQQRGEQAAERIERHGIFYDHFLQITAYRDMDFVFQSPDAHGNGVGARVYVEMAKLLERLRYRKEPKAPPMQLSTQWNPIPMPHPIDGLKVACYATGPETSSIAFCDEIVEKIQKAKESICIAHMYVHPPKPLLQALIDASNRGVKITILTNKLGSRSPGSHLTYAELSRYFVKSLFEGRKKSNIAFYEYDVPYATFHKKVILIDSKVTFIGSANIGQKSLDGSDYEIDLEIESEPFAASIAEILEADKQLCQRDENPQISCKTRLYSTVQSLFMPFL